MARGPFAAQGLADIFALLCLSPWLRPAVMKLNGLFHKADRKHAVAEGESIIGKPHYDGRYFSALSGERDTILTQLFDGRRWHGVELNSGELDRKSGGQGKRVSGRGDHGGRRIITKK